MGDIIALNGRLLPRAEAGVGVSDRCFMYGDGVFETLLARNSVLLWWRAHYERLAEGCRVLGIVAPQAGELRGAAIKLLEANDCASAIVRIQVSRGGGPRGLSPAQAGPALTVITSYPVAPITKTPQPGWRVITSSITLPPENILSRCKTCNRLPYILAKAQADASGADEALLLGLSEEPLEGSAANLFWIRDNAVCTSPVSAGVLPGVTRGKVIESCSRLGLAFREELTNLACLRGSEGVFFTLTSLGVVNAIALDGATLPVSPVANEIRQHYVSAAATYFSADPEQRSI